jgi:hypothetical protein
MVCGGTDAIRQILRDLATTPRGTIDAVDRVLDNLILVFVPTINPDGRVAGTRRNGNNFDMNRDFFTQSQDEVKASVAIMRDGLPVGMLDLHGYYGRPRLQRGVLAGRRDRATAVDGVLQGRWRLRRGRSEWRRVHLLARPVGRRLADQLTHESISMGPPARDNAWARR